jgi:hypothetical protein
MNRPLSRWLAVLLFSSAGLLFALVLIKRESPQPKALVPEPVQAIDGEQASEELDHRQVVLTAPDAGSAPDASASPESEVNGTNESRATGLAWWRGKPTQEFLCNYWNVSEAELVASLIEDGFPEPAFQRLLPRPVPNSLVEWSEAITKIKTELVAAIQADAGNADRAFTHAWRVDLSSLVDKLVSYLEENHQVGPLKSYELSSGLLNDCGVAMDAHTAFLDSLERWGLFLLDSGDVDRFPVLTVPQGRRKQRVPTEFPQVYKGLNLMGGGWVVQFILFKGGSAEVDQCHLALKERWLDVIIGSVLRQTGVQVTAQVLADLGLR